MKAPVIWLTGIPASGKTTIALELKKYFENKGLLVEILDGDEIRKTLSKDLGFSPEDRKEHNRRVIFIAQILTKNGVTTLIPLISPYRETRDFARNEIQRFVEVWIKASVDECIKRDPKGLYAQVWPRPHQTSLPAVCGITRKATATSGGSGGAPSKILPRNAPGLRERQSCLEMRQ